MSLSLSKSLTFDVVLFGGGVAGLWILNRLCNEGYNAVLFEQSSLGSGQTIASQGMIHGGMKYTLSGALSGASEAIADMPDHWRNCLAGKGDVNLTHTKTLSDHFYMWSSDNTLSKITTFFASKTLRGRIDALHSKDFPAVFNTPQFNGKLYQLVDSVIDTPSLLANLAHNVKDRIFTIDWNQSHLDVNSQDIQLIIQHAGNNIAISAQRFIFSAGRGNDSLLQSVGAVKPLMQLRPLQQVMVKHKNRHFLYAHCIGTDSTPRLTISSHLCADGDMCWYLGGQLAEKGVNKPASHLIAEAKSELTLLFPWLNWKHAEWATLPVVRAEPQQPNFVRPDKAFIGPAYSENNKSSLNNVLVAWPTKLTLCPNLGNETLALLKYSHITPGAQITNPASLNFLPTPPVAQSPWDVAQWQTMDGTL